MMFMEMRQRLHGLCVTGGLDRLWRYSLREYKN